MPAYAGITILFQLRASTDELEENIGFKESRSRGFKGKAIQNLLMFPVVVDGDRSNP